MNPTGGSTNDIATLLSLRRTFGHPAKQTFGTNAYEVRRDAPYNGFVIRSYGPDYRDDTDHKNWPWAKGVVYDPTNGTKSSGDTVKEVPRKARGLYDPSFVPGPGTDPWL